MRPSGAVADGTKIRFTYPEHALFALEAELSIDSDSGCPMLSCTLRPKADGWYSVGFTGYEAADTAHVTELWQPMICRNAAFPTAAMPRWRSAAPCLRPSSLPTA